MTIVCRSSAKVNLTLDILERRADGYHELQSIVHTVGLWDTLTLEFGKGQGITLRCDGPALGGADNLCLRAAHAWDKAVRSKEKSPLNNLCITLQKQIPCGAGLGGGSGNAAAVLLALNQQFEDPLTAEELNQTAATLGADVPLFLRSGCALMEGIGEKLTPLPHITGWLVLVQPPQALSTPVVYRQWDEMQLSSMRATPHLLEAVCAEDFSGTATALGNDLSSAAQALGVPVEKIVELLNQNGSAGAVMTGSGSCVFGVFENEDEARHASATLDLADFWVSVAPFVSQGVEFSEASFVTSA